MGRLPTASGLTRAMACPTSCVLPQVTTATSAAANLGREVHLYVEALANGDDADKVAAGLSEAGRTFCAGLEPETLPVDLSAGWLSEVAYGYSPANNEGRELDASGRSYGNLPDGWLAGTADLVRVAGDTAVVVDVKTGRGWLPKPSESGQLKFLALAVSAAYGVSEVSVGHLKLRDDGRAWLELDTLDALALADARDQLMDAAARVALGEVAPKEGPWCRYCPGFASCPAKAALAAASVGAPAVLTPETAAAAWQRLKDVRQVLDRVEAALKEYAQESPFPLPEGWEVGPVESRRETVDGAKAESVARSMLGDLAAQAFEVSTTKGALEAAVSAFVVAEKAAGRKATKKVTLAALWDALRESGAVVETTRVDVKERRSK